MTIPPHHHHQRQTVLTPGILARLLALLPLLTVLASCTTLPRMAAPLSTHLAAGGETAACAGFLQAFDRQVAGAGVADAQTARIAGFPYLRSSRFLASFRDELEPEWRLVWLQALRTLGRQAQQVELANLPATAATWQALGVEGRAAARERLEACSNRLMALDSLHPATWKRLRERSAVPDAYADYQRLLGLYPLTALAARWGMASLYVRIRATFEQAPDSLPVAGELVDYTPEPRKVTGPSAVTEWYAGVPRNALGMPQLSAKQLDGLFHRYAPIWRIDSGGHADRIGAPYLDGETLVAIDTERPVVYLHTSHTRWQGKTLLQLNYVIWFPARPKTGMLDLLGGHLDGITWRVTLDATGSPLLYDAMHNCGCYHMAFPAGRLEPRERTGIWQEPLLVPAQGPVPGKAERLRIRIEQGSHYLQAVEVVKDYTAAWRYRFQDYSVLRSLATGDGQRQSMFDQQGLVPGTERLERWLLWPMGVPEPGAMRQWGTHATAFVGKRHFDDPDLAERYFTSNQ